jgi:MFS transporter, DHA1 family, multidrug resistance protein
MREGIKGSFQGKAPSVAALMLIISMGTIGAVLFTPAISVMAVFFQVSASTIQYAITVYLFGYSLAQLIHGPLANRFGRKPVLLWGLALAVLFNALCALSKPLDSLTLLLIARFFAALCAGVGLVITLTMISDVFTEERAAGIVPITAISFAVLPGIAICIGGFIAEYLGWDWCFYALSFYYCIGFVLALFMPETQEKSAERTVSAGCVIKNYVSLARDTRLLSYSIMVALTTILVYVYAAVAPLLTVQDLGLKASEYGLLSLAPFVCYAFGNLTISSLNKKNIAMRKTTAAAYLCTLVLSCVFFVDVLLRKLNIWSFYIVICLVFFCIPTIWSNSSVKATAKITDKANANAVLSFINISGCVIGLLVVAETSGLPRELSTSSIFLLVSITLTVVGIRNYRKYPR